MTLRDLIKLIVEGIINCSTLVDEVIDCSLEKINVRFQGELVHIVDQSEFVDHEEEFRSSGS